MSPGDTTHSGSHRLQTGAGLLLLAVASLSWPGYRFGGSNQSIQIPLLRWEVDPQLYRFDLLRDSFDGYASWFFKALAPLVRLVGDVEVVYFALYALILTASLAAVHAIARRLGGGEGAALLACLFFLSQYPSLAGESTHWNGLTHAEAGAALLLWALHLHLGGRLLTALALCGVAFDLHALFALHLAFLLLFDAWIGGGVRSWREPAKAGALFALLAAPTLVWLLTHGGGTPEPFDDWLRILRARSGHHAFPFTVPLAVYARYGLLLALGALALAREASPGERSRAARWAGGVALLAAAGVVFAEWLPLSSVIRAQLLRSTKWLTLLLLFPLARLVVAAWAGGGAARLSAALLVVGLLLREPAGLLLALLLLLLAEPARNGRAATLLGAAALALVGIGAAVTVPDRLVLPEAGRTLQLLLRGETLVAAAAFAAMRCAAPAWRARAAGLAVALALLVLLPRIQAREHAAVRTESWTRVQLWVRDHTPEESLLLTPPYADGFRVFSERSVVGEWKDGTQQFFDAGFGFAWWERMQELGGDTRRYDRMPAARLQELGRLYGAEIAVVRADSAPELRRLFEEGEWAVVSLQAEPSTAP